MILDEKLSNMVEYLTDEETAQLFRAILHYQSTGEEIEMDRIVQIVFVLVKQSISENENKNDEVSKKRAEAGRKGMEKRWGKSSDDVEPITNDNNVITDITPITNDNKNNKTEQDYIYKYIIDYLNQRCNTRYRNNTKSTRKLINARLNQGFVLDDFIKVIDTKAFTWMGTEFEKYLRPETLFGNKFESYLNEKIRSKNPFMNMLSERSDYDDSG